MILIPEASIVACCRLTNVSRYFISGLLILDWRLEQMSLSQRPQASTSVGWRPQANTAHPLAVVGKHSTPEVSEVAATSTILNAAAHVAAWDLLGRSCWKLQQDCAPREISTKRPEA